MAQANSPLPAASTNTAEGTKQHRQPRHQIKRSLTELAGPVRLPRHNDKDRQQQQLRGRDLKDHDERRHSPRHHQHHHGHHTHKDRDEHRSGLVNQLLPVPGSAGGHHFFGRASADMPRSERTSSYFGSDLDRSRRPSLVGGGGAAGPGKIDISNAASGVIAGDIQRRAKGKTKAEREALLLRERADAISRANALRTSLAELSAFSNDATKTLDDSYYSVLERLGTLQQTIVALRELASLSSDLAQSFKHDSSELTEEIEAQIQPFGELDEHQDRIKSLQQRITVGRDKTKGLTERVDRVRERVEGWEAADQDWRVRTRKRLRVIWVVVVTTAIIMLLLVLLGAHQDELLSASTTAAAVGAASALSSGISSAGASVYSSAVHRPVTTGNSGGDVGPDTLGDALPAESKAEQRCHEDDAVGGLRRLIDEVTEAFRARQQEDRPDPDVLRVLDEL
ncbi:uncharacterized protein B0I36DRAFT_360723 [Microdochium trichocladiopsis]|uniref:Uncharacterized protein n=1 Tax=Microdochium trichocladiopsis TaxID=1682393 RepID=A0A9P8YE87_9PEZI|nr:uncharacterized protein B0I36DRAFT_360723 [Microdochium trichocladiopsis]KAH7035337.1 hypothetical protein B0I36DRAFT_360723 [Microdochium trichocladiopsis]